MKYIKWKTLFITSLICLLPILFGAFIWDSLPEKMAVHFDLYNNPDNFFPKGFAVFGLSFLMMVFNFISCIAYDISIYKYGEKNKSERVVKWIIPVLTVVLQGVTFGYNLGYNIDIKMLASIVVGVVFLITGNYVFKLDYVKNYNTTKEKAKKINRFMGAGTVIMGILFIISAFLPPNAMKVCLFLFILYGVLNAVFATIIQKKSQ